MPNRRSFLKNTLLTSTGLLLLPLLSFEEKLPGELSEDDLEKGFINSPHSARPQAYWMWMNGHITHKGITLDLERMKEMGLSGAFIFNTGTGILMDFITVLPSWYLNSQPKTGKRKTFSVWNNFTKTDPLLPAGLLGPVRLITGWKRKLTDQTTED